MLLNTSHKGAKSITFIGGRDQLFVSRERLIGYQSLKKNMNLMLTKTHCSGRWIYDWVVTTIKELRGRNDWWLVTADSLFAEGARALFKREAYSDGDYHIRLCTPSVQIDAYVDVHTLELDVLLHFKILRNVIKSNNSKNMMWVTVKSFHTRLKNYN